MKSLRKTGRPAAVYHASWGEQIPGIMRLGDGRWRLSGPDKVTFSEDDERLAIARFKAMQNAKSVVPLPAASVPFDDLDESKMPIVDVSTVDGRIVSKPVAKSKAQYQLSTPLGVPEAAVLAWCRQQIIAEPKRAAQMLGIEQIGYLADLPKPTVSPTLEEVPQPYLGKAKITEDWRVKTKLFWREFRDSVGVIRLSVI
jgi:hypothetical protein